MKSGLHSRRLSVMYDKFKLKEQEVAQAEMLCRKRARAQTALENEAPRPSPIARERQFNPKVYKVDSRFIRNLMERELRLKAIRENLASIDLCPRESPSLQTQIARIAGREPNE